MVAGAQAQATSMEEGLALVRARMDDGEKLSSAVGEVARATGLSRKQLYEAALAARKA